jgi:biotin-dependent carboxylase-like uncharacterized protein
MGRPGWGAYGVPEGGALDRDSLRRANLLVGNPPSAPALEFSYRGPTLRWRGSRPIECAVIGDEDNLRTVRPQDELYAGFPTQSAHGYLAVPGGFVAERILGARGTCLAGGFGGHHGRALITGDVLAVAPIAGTTGARGRLPARREERSEITLRVLPFGETDSYARTFRRLIRRAWQVDAGDRVGVSLRGASLRLHSLGLSQPTTPGCIQVSGAGRPILLLRDHPTVGGYPVVAVVAQADMDRAGRLRQGQTVRFQGISESDALQLLRVS